MKEEKFPSTRKPFHWWVCGGFWNLKEQHNQKEKKNPQIMRLTTTPSREVAQNLTSTSSKWGLNREVQTAMLREKNRPECPEDNLKELT